MEGQNLSHWEGTLGGPSERSAKRSCGVWDESSSVTIMGREEASRRSFSVGEAVAGNNPDHVRFSLVWFCD